MNNLLGLEFIKFFHNSTIHLENEGPRLLHVDCHASHINLPLINFARLHNIIIFGYPPHTTHLLQGLDVVMFSPFKNAYAKRAAEHLREKGRDVEKKDFLSVLHMAVQDSFKTESILMAWKKTGLRPINHNVISDSDLAPSKAFSTTHSLPLSPPSPIRAIVDAIHRQNALQGAIGSDSPPPTLTPTPTSTVPLPSEPTVDQNCIPDRYTGTSLLYSTTSSVPLPLPTHLPATLFPSILPDPLVLLTTQISLMTLGEHGASKFLPINPTATLRETHLEKQSRIDACHDVTATYIAGDILRSLASTRLRPLLELETVTSAIELPPVERGPVPHQLAKVIKTVEGLPSEELWNSVRDEFSAVVARQERLYAQVILQETYCQQAQRSLGIKEQVRKKSTLKRINDMPGGFIFTADEAHQLLEADAATKSAEEQEANAKKDANQLVKDAKEWKLQAVARQGIKHAALIAHWEAQPPETRLQRPPRKPKIDPTPDEYKEALKPKKKKASKRTESEDESDVSLEEWV